MNGSLNDLWAECLVDQLVQMGVDYFFIAPGSRSTPLVLAVHNHPRARDLVHFDERGLGFCALGYAKGKQKAAAIITTSGTAAGNLLPAIMEADQFHIPLIILTADRPYDQLDIGANQTTNQSRMFGNYVRYQIDLPPPTSNDVAYLCSAAAYAVQRTMNPLKGPVHLNCMFREPLFSDPQFSSLSPRTTYFRSIPTLSKSAFEEIRVLVGSFSKGAVIIGNDLTKEEAEAVVALADHLQWPLFDDILSNIRSRNSYYYDFFLNLIEKPDCILHFGNRFVSKKLLQWVGGCPNYVVINAHDQRVDPTLSMTHAIHCDPLLFCQEMGSIEKKDDSYLRSIRDLNHSVRTQIERFFEEEAPLSESAFFHQLNQLPTQELMLFLGTSMPVRDGNTLLYPDEPFYAIFSNRGVSGIDGNIATACGLALALQKPMIALVGDQTVLHDLNSLALLSQVATPLLVVVINNGGGTIFAHLPISSRSDVIDRYFLAQHTYDFKAAAAQFKLPYETASEIPFPFKSGVIEVCVDQAHSIETRKQLYKVIEAGLMACKN